MRLSTDLGEKRFAVPLGVFQFEPGADALVLNVTREQLKSEGGFEKGNWPDSSDVKYVERLERHYGTSRGLPDSPYANREKSEIELERSQNYRAFRASLLLGKEVMNAQGEQVGRLEDLVLNMNDGQIHYAVLSFGGAMGLGAKLYPVPMQALKLPWDSGPYRDYVVVDTRELQLDQRRGFDKNRWPNVNDFAAALQRGG